jgi:hypothetical protein
MTLRQQLMLKRALRNLRTWAPPISIGVIIGVLVFFAVEHSDRANAEPQQSVAISYAGSPPPQQQAEMLQSVQIERQRHPIESDETEAFRNCAAARAAGAAPVYAGEPGYGAHLDRDGDGIGCEPYRN